MKVALIGGSSPSTPAFAEALATLPRVPVSELVLLGRCRIATAAVARASALLAMGRFKVRSQLIGNRGWERALDGAAITVLQIRVGGYDGRAFFETFPLRHGVWGDHAIGPGGLAAAWYSWPAVARFTRVVEARAPGSFLAVLTSPVGILTRLCLAAAPSLGVVGVCELPWTTLRQVATVFGLRPNEIDFDYFGLNHLGWFHRLQSEKRDLLNEYANLLAARGDWSAGLVRRYGGVPLRYWRLHFESPTKRKDLAEAGKRSAFLVDYRERALRVFELGGPDEIRAILRQRSAPWYSEAVVPLIEAVAGETTRIPLFLSVPQRGTVRKLDHSTFLEVTHSARAGRLVPRSLSTPVPMGIAELVGGYIRFEEEAVQAVATRKPHSLVDAIRLHPWTTSERVAGSLADEILAAAGHFTDGELKD